MKLVPYGKQYIDNDDIRNVSKSLKNEKITTGKVVEKFENNLKKFLKSKYALTCNSGTSALFLIFQSLGIKKNDIIIMPSITFVASYNIAKLFGAKVYLADVDKFTGQMYPSHVEDCCKKFKLRRVDIIVTMYNGGYPYYVDKFISLKKKYNALIVEDACHAFGASYTLKGKNYKVGSCKHSNLAAFSFHPLKSITTGEGGLVTTNNKKFYKKIKELRSLGIQRSPKKHWQYQVVGNGLNFRLTDFQCALGISQLVKIKKF